MNKPIDRPVADPDIGPLDANGEQIWSPEEEAAIARVMSDRAAVDIEAAADADIANGRERSHAEHCAWMDERKREWFAQRGL